MQLAIDDKKEQEGLDERSALWEALRHAPDDESCYHVWLRLQCLMVPHCVSGLLVVADAAGAYAPVSRWPETGGNIPGLAEILEQVMEDKCPLLTRLAGEGPAGTYALAYPVLIDGALHGAVAVEVSPETEEELKQVMEQLQWGISWIELRFYKGAVVTHEAESLRMKAAVTLLSEVLSVERFEGAAMAFVTRLATRLHCDRVSIGFKKKKKIRVQAVSHSAKFADRMNLIRSIEKAMEEAVVQRREIRYPEDQHEVVILRDHRELSSRFGDGHILTVPLYDGGRYLGAVMLERPVEMGFSEEEVEYCRSVAALSAPVLEQKRALDRPLFFKLTDAFRLQLERVVGPGFLGRKAFLFLAVLLCLFFANKQGDYRISSHVVLEGEIMRAVSAPFNGYVKASTLRAGDVVAKGDVLCLLDDRDLRLERFNWLNRRTQLKRERQEAMAEHNRSEVNVINARIKQADAQLELAEHKLERSAIKAPFDGLLVSGDLARSLGSMVQQGEVLFEVTPLDAYRVIINVDESRIADVSMGQQGTLVLSSLPDSPFDFTVTKITPIAIAEEGKNAFRVEATLSHVTGQLRPGMEGVGKIFVDRRNLFSIWTRSLREKVTLWLWAWWP
ncbi:HlyD family efflux transporter periplasmic adaptor subunit [Desulfoluna sp.]|uniref:HlyD family efflux transporter periplasmic adaptor subunit n=1 Tax=Desulfoluna sp. TaxID=2045199 RepID=UPI00260939E1|nr:HlyD family efflux transporter periplasmic adaptor subunit [Desulfoluna sp.]